MLSLLAPLWAIAGASRATETVWLDELDVGLSTCGWRQSARNRSVGGNPLWLDCNSDFFGSYENLDAQALGEVVRPTLESP